MKFILLLVVVIMATTVIGMSHRHRRPHPAVTSGEITFFFEQVITPPLFK